MYPPYQSNSIKNTQGLPLIALKRPCPFINILTNMYEAYAPKFSVKWPYLYLNPRYIRANSRQVLLS